MNRNLGNDFEMLGVDVVRDVISQQTLVAARTALEMMLAQQRNTSAMLFTHKEPQFPVSLSALMEQYRNVFQNAPDPLITMLDTLRVVVRDVVDYEPVPFQDVFLRKPHNSEPIPWHQDLPFWPIDREDGCVAWLALDKCDASNGAVEFGTNPRQARVGPSIDFRTGLAQPGTSGTVIVPEKVIQPFLDPGDVVIFHAQTWHRSGKNTTALPRSGLAVSFVHPEARWCHRRAPRHPLCLSVTSGERVILWSQRTYRHTPD